MIAAVEPGSGRVRALAANRIFAPDDPRAPRNLPASNPAKARSGARGSYPHTMNPILTGGGDITGYQAGSVFKIFTVVAALEKGYPLSYTINAPKVYRSSYPEARTGPGARRARGTVRATSTTAWWGCITCGPPSAARSTPTSCRSKSVSGGARGGRGPADGHPVPRPTRGGDRPRPVPGRGEPVGSVHPRGVGHHPLDVATAYATLAADGTYCEPTPVEEIWDHQGQRLTVADPRCRHVVESEVARAAIDVARCPVGDKSRLRRMHEGHRPRRAPHGRPPHRRKDRHHRPAADRVVSGHHPVAHGRRNPRRPGLAGDHREDGAQGGRPGGLSHPRRRDARQATEPFPKPSRRLAYGDQVKSPT